MKKTLAALLLIFISLTEISMAIAKDLNEAAEHINRSKSTGMI